MDRISKAMIELLPPEVRAACRRAAVEIGTPDAQGARVHPAVWQLVPVQLIDKKKPSLLIEKKRDIGLPSQNLKLQGALYMPAYTAVMPRLADVNHGWTPGMAARGAAMVGGFALDQALLLCHLLIGIYGDIKRMFPSMDRDVVLLSEMWFGLPRDAREATRALYQDACMMYETEHGLPDFDFQTLHMTTGAIQGCLLSTEKAKLFLNSLAEAFNVLAGGGGIRFWNGRRNGGVRETSTFCADDLLGMVTCWPAATAFVAVIDEWRGTTASAFGIEGYSKTTYSAVDVGADGTPRDAVAPDGLVLRVNGEPIPRLPFDEWYAHIGDRRKFNGEQDAELAQVTSLCQGWLRRMERMSRCSKQEFTELSNGGFGAFIGAYAHCAPLTFAEGDEIEKSRRKLYRRRFRGHATCYNCDRYLPAAWQPEPRYGLVTEGIHEARMIGDGWHHAAALAASYLHDAMTSALFDGIDSQLRRCARSSLDLLMFMWGMRGSHPAVWECDHLRHVLARRSGGGRSARGTRIYPMEMFLLRFLEMRSLTVGSQGGRPPWNFRLVHEPAEDDPFCPHAPHHLPLDRDTLELYRGELVDPRRCHTVLGRQREPCWVLLRAGVVMRSHACRADGSGFMGFAEAAQVIPSLVATSVVRAEAAAAWKQLVSDLVALDVEPVPGEPVTSASSIWRGGPRIHSSDGDARVGGRADLDDLIARLQSGDAAAAGEWAAAYRSLANGRAPRPPCEREMPAATQEERCGPHTRYFMPGKKGAREEMVRGRSPPTPTVHDRDLLQLYRRQHWRVAADGRSIRCLHGSTLGTASVVVQLFANALEVALTAHAARVKKTQLRREQQLAHCRRRQEPPPPPPALTEEERSWAGGPGFNVSLTNAMMSELLELEQRQGFVFTAAAVGDGSWQPRDHTVSRAALLHDGTVVGGALEVDDLVGGSRHNYDGEAVHRIDVLATLTHSRLLYIFDSTSPVCAGEHFRRATTATRAKMECDEWLGSTMGFEQRQDAIVYWWSKSHRGHLPEAAADALANGFLGADPTGVPYLPSRHVSARGYAKSSERELMLYASNLFFVREHFTRGDAIRATTTDVDAMRNAKLNELQRLRVLRLRDDHARLMSSRAFPHTKAMSVGAQLRATQCPCGHGTQDRQHLLWQCRLPRVSQIRHTRLFPACVALRDQLNTCEPVAGVHAVSHACCRALEQGCLPRSAGGMAVGGSGAVLSDGDTVEAATRHLLGVVVCPDSSAGLKRALRLAKPMLVAVADMLQASERATEVTIRCVFARHRAQQTLRSCFHFLRAETFEQGMFQRQTLPPLAPVRRSTPRVRANTIAPVTPVAMVTSPRQFGGAVIQRALQSADPHTAVTQVAGEMRRVAGAAAARAASDLVATQIGADALLTVGELRTVRLPPPVPRHSAAALSPPPLAQLRVLEARRKRPVAETVATMSGGGDVLYWERRQRMFECARARNESLRSSAEAAASLAFVEWYVAYHAARVAAVARERKRRARIAACVAAERARCAPLTTEARHAAKARATRRDAEEAAVRWRLANPAYVAQLAVARERSAAAIAAARGAIAAAASVAARRALQLVEGVRSVTPHGAPVPGVLVGGEGSAGDAEGGGMTLRRAEVIPEHLLR
jgi:hypothetical protein